MNKKRFVRKIERLALPGEFEAAEKLLRDGLSTDKVFTLVDLSMSQILDLEQEHLMGRAHRQQVGAREEGRQEGRKEEKFAIARKLLKKNIPVDEIAELAELDVAEVKELKRKI